MQGAFTNVCAYSEWWGALPSLSKPASNDKRQNCRDAIQKAIDSVFPEVHFCKGYYYLSAVEELDKDEALAEENDGEPEDDAAGLQEPVSLLVMSKPKSLILSGHGRLGDGVNPFSAATVLWTDENINLLLVDIQTDKQECYPFVIEGGEFNVSECKGFTKSVLLIYPYKLTQVRIATTLIGPIPIKRRAGGVMGWDSNYPHPTTEMVDGGYKGYGIRFTTDPSLSEKRKEPASCIFTTIDSSIFGFGHGLAIDYNPEVDDMTSTVLKGFMDNCFRYVYAPSRAFNGGTIECAIQTRDVNALDGIPEAIIQGNMQEAYLNPMIWDANDGVNLFQITEGNRMRFGQRALDRMCHHSKSAGMTDDFPSGHPVSGDSANNSDSDEPVIGGEVDPLSVSMPTLASSVAKPTENDNWEQGVRGLAAVMSSDSGAVAGALGNFDLNALSAVNARVQSANYLHVVDNDLLSIDAVEKGYEIHVEQNGLEGIYSNYVAGIWKPGTSPFDRDGMVFAFLNDDDVNSANLPNARIEVTITFPKYGSRSFQFLAFHLKSATYFYFDNLKIMSHYDLTTTKENGQTVISNYTETLFDGPYADVPQQDGYRDIILPFLFNSRTKRIFPKKLTVIFSGLVRKS